MLRCASALCDARPLGRAIHEAALEDLAAMAWLGFVRPQPVDMRVEQPRGGRCTWRVVALALLALGMLFALGRGIDVSAGALSGGTAPVAGTR